MFRFDEIIAYFSLLVPIIALIGVIIGAFTFKSQHRTMRPLIFLLASSFGVEVFSHFAAKYYGSNLIFINIYALIEFVFLFLFVKDNIRQRKKYFNYIFFAILLFNFYEIIIVDYKNFDMFQIYSRTINSIYILTVAMLVILAKISEDNLHKLNRIYYLLPLVMVVNSLLYLPLNILINYTNIRVFIVWFVNSINYLVFFSFITFQLWKSGRIRKA